MARHHEIRQIERLPLESIADGLAVAVLDRLDRHTEAAQLILVALERSKDALAFRVRDVVAGNVLRELLERRVSLADEERREEVDPTLELLLTRREVAIRGRGRIVQVVVI